MTATMFAGISLGMSVMGLVGFVCIWNYMVITARYMRHSNRNAIKQCQYHVEEFRKITKEASEANLSQANKIDEMHKRMLKIEERLSFMGQIKR